VTPGRSRASVVRGNFEGGRACNRGNTSGHVDRAIRPASWRPGLHDRAALLAAPKVLGVRELRRRVCARRARVTSVQPADVV
jgi:hypothetical protein